MHVEVFKADKRIALKLKLKLRFSQNNVFQDYRTADFFHSDMRHEPRSIRRRRNLYSD